MDRIQHLLGIAKKAGRLEIGEEPVGGACRAKKAKAVLIAADAAENSARRAEHFGEAGGAVCIQLPLTKAELGAAVGRSACAMLAITDAGLAAALCAPLAASDGEQYGQAAALLADRAQRALQRQKEQRIHQRRLKRQAEKPWCAPPKSKGAAKPLNQKPAAPVRPAAKKRLSNRGGSVPPAE